MHITLISSPRAQHQLEHQSALAAGFEALGFDVTLTHGQAAGAGGLVRSCVLLAMKCW